MTEAIERIAQAMVDALEPEDAASYMDVKSIESVVMDGRFDFMAAARKLIEAGLVAPSPLQEIQAETKFKETYRRWATDWERA